MKIILTISLTYYINLLMNIKSNNLFQIAKNILYNKIGIDKVIIWIILGRTWAIIAGPLSLFLIAKKLTIEEQGYYYIFSNLISIAMFFELGLGGWILRFTSYEMNKVSLSKQKIEGDKVSIARLSSILKFSLHWFLIASILFFIIEIIFGFYFFASNKKIITIFCQLPLVLIAMFAAIDLLISPLVAFLEGAGFIEKIAKLNFYRTLISNLVLWAALIIGMKLNSMPLMSFFSLILIIIFLLKWKKPIFQILKFKVDEEGFNYKKELLPLQLKTGITVIAGYFTWQTANLILFKIEGPSESAKLGMSINLCTMLLSFGMAWINTKVPKFGLLYGAQKYNELKTIFSQSLKKVIFIVTLGSLIMLIADLIAIHFNNPIALRILNPIDFTILLISNLFVAIQNSFAVFNRTFKNEPFVIQMIIMGIMMPLVCYFMGKIWSTRGIVIAIALVNLTIGLIWSFYINRKQQKYLQIAKN